MLYAWVLSEHANPDIRIDRVLHMLLLHDIVEIDAGDHPIHGQVDHAAQAAEEEAAAERLVRTSAPTDQRRNFQSYGGNLKRRSPGRKVRQGCRPVSEHRYCNLETGGGSWIDYNVTYAQIEVACPACH